MEQLKYPDDIEDDKFENRRVVFMALTGETNESKSSYLRGITKGSGVSENEYTKNRGNAITDFIKRNTTIEGMSKYNKGIEDFTNEVGGFFEGSELRCLITLPLPGSLTDSQSHNWSQENLTELIGGGIADVSKSFDTKSKGITNVVSKFSKVFEGVSKYSGLASQLTGSRKPTVNPGFFQNYTASSLRSFSFSFNFVPESKNEAINIVNIVKAFKQYSSPSEYAEKDCMLLSPYRWYINVSNNTVNEMISLKECVCTSVQVTYGNDKFDCFDDGMPKKITLQLQFTECSLQYANNYGYKESVSNYTESNKEHVYINASNKVIKNE